MREKKNRVGLVIGILLLVIIVLIIIVVYAFVVRPTITGYVVNAQNQGYEQAIIQIAQQAVSCQQVPLRIGNETMNIIWVDCLRQQAPLQ